MSNAFKFRMPAGIPGDVSRKESATVEPNVIDSAAPPTVYGNVVKMVSGKIRPFAGGEAATDVYGLLVRPYPTNAGTDGLGTSTPPTSGPCDVLKRGYLNVKLNGNRSATKGGAVYVRVAAAQDPTSKPIGGFEAEDDGDRTVTLDNAYFTGAEDENGNIEIAYNL